MAECLKERQAEDPDGQAEQIEQRLGGQARRNPPITLATGLLAAILNFD